MKPTMKFEDFAHVNVSDLGNNWSADYHVNKKKGKTPYIKVNNLFIEVDIKKTLPKDAIYLSPEQVEKLNLIGEELNKLKIQQEEILNQQRSILNLKK